MEKITVVYDKIGNTLDVWFGKPRRAICEEVGHGIIIKKDRRGNVLGFEKLNYVKTKKEVKALPVEVVLA